MSDTNESVIGEMHDYKPVLTRPAPTTLKTLLPEINSNQWKMFKQVLVHDLFLTDKQVVHLNRLLGE